MNTCPSCSSEFDSERAVKIHHKMKHGESLASKTTTCEIHGCEETVEYYPTNKSGKVCPSCVSDGKNIWSVDTISNEKIKQKISTESEIELTCHWCCDVFTDKDKSKKDRKTFCSKSCRSAYQSDKMTGKDNPRYIDGESSGANYGSMWRSVRNETLERDNYACVICDSEDTLHVHHIIPVRSFDDICQAHYIENTVTLCASCHRCVEYGSKTIPETHISEHSLETYDGSYVNQKT